jgi:DNA modification methylase
MGDIADGSVDLILADLPYGTTACKWDTVIPFAPLWAQYKRVIKRNGAIVLTASQPFTSALVMSNPKWFRYELVWDKVNRYTGYANANRMPLRRHENICVFSQAGMTFNKQFREGKPYRATRTNGYGEHMRNCPVRLDTINDGQHNPCSILPFKGDIKSEMGLHPTQKPVALMEYLIRTYTNEGELVLDNTMGSGTTGVACLNTGRRFIGMEKDAEIFATAQSRIAEAQSARESLLIPA